MKQTLEERFWSKVHLPTCGEDCWPWFGTRDRYGYGTFRQGGHLVRSHRFAYELMVGPIPNGLVIDHLCRTRACMNPSHMEAVTNKTNILRGISDAALNARKTHCERGHAFSLENTHVRPDGRRMCRECNRK